MLEIAKGLAEIPAVRIFRAGIWKPRTRPGQFEGMGVEALPWLKEVKEQFGFLTAVEVANPQHIEAALKHDVDILWIGARTSVNPFTVSELAETLRGTDVGVMIKNPVNPDIQLWMGAIERFHAAGIRKLAAIHRGFSYFRKSPFRNAPMWELPIELKRICPALPVITDPSHICGNTSMLLAVAQKALDLEMDGLMIETHDNPEIALTDKEQQITPANLKLLLSQLIIRKKSGTPNFQDKLEQMRSEIDRLDHEMLEILSRRMEIIDEIGHYKKDNNITILQLKRWREMLQERIDSGLASGLSRPFLMDMLQLLHDESIRRQEVIFRNENEDAKLDGA